MNIQRFHAPTAREALLLARQTFGDGTLILSNRPTANGVEVVATAEESLAAVARTPGRASAAAAASDASAPGKDSEDMAMSTLSFQSYVRERMLRRRQEELGTAAPPPQRAASAPAQSPRPLPSAALSVAPQTTSALERAPASQRPAPPSASISSQSIVDELHNMKELIEERFTTLSWLGQARQDPIQSNLMLKLIRAGYSPSLARGVLERMPKSSDGAHAARWVMDVLERNLKTDAGQAQLQDEGGVFALVGATGVGKTTTAAKLAALCVRSHGPNSVGLITLDTYRVAAMDQLRGYGRMLGVVAHLAHDRAALQDLLSLLANKKMILIDTAGVAPHDPKKGEMVDDVLDLPHVKRLLVLNACGHGDTLDDVLTSFKHNSAQQVLLSKVDEAVKLGPALDAVIRHQVTLRGITNGQRVPEDWESADPGKLVRMSLQASAKSAFDPQPDDLNFFFSPAPTQHHRQGMLHA